MRFAFSFIVLLPIGWIISAEAANIYWTNGNSSGLFNDAGNWSTGTVPGSSDIAFFDASYTNDDCHLNLSRTVQGIRMQNGYSGTFYQDNGRSLTVNGSGFRQYSGNFVGGNSTISIVNGYDKNNGLAGLHIAGGSFTSTAGTVQFTGFNEFQIYMIRQTGGVFLHNGGKLDFSPNSGWCCNPLWVEFINGTDLFDVRLNQGGSNGMYVQFVNSPRILGELTHDDGLLFGDVYLEGNLTIGPNADGGNGFINFVGNGNQTYGYTGARRRTGGVIINKTGGTVQAAPGTTEFDVTTFQLISGSFKAPTGTFYVRGTSGADGLIFRHTGGSFDHGNGTLRILTYWSGQNWKEIYILNSTRFHHVILENNSVQTFPVNIVNAELYAQGNLTLVNGIFHGNIGVEGNVTVNSTYDGGSASLRFRGGNNQTYTDQGGNEPDGDVTINKSGGTLTLASNVDWNATNQDVILQSGIVAHSTHTLNFGTYTQSGGTFNGGSGNITLGGIFTLTNGNFQSTSGILRMSSYSNPCSGAPVSGTVIFSYQGGHFDHHNGTVRFDNDGGCGGHTIVVHIGQPSLTLYKVIFDKTTGWEGGTYQMSGGTLDVLHTLTLSDGTLTGEQVDLKGHLVVLGGADGTNRSKGIRMYGSTPATYTRTSPGMAPKLIIDKDPGVSVSPAIGTTSLGVDQFHLLSGTFVAPSGNLTIGETKLGCYHGNNEDVLLYSGGTFDYTTNPGGTMDIYQISQCEPFNAYLTLNLPLTVNNLNVFHDNSYRVAFRSVFTIRGTSATINAKGNVRFRDGILNGGSILVDRNVTVETNMSGGTTTLTFTGSANQTFQNLGGNEPDGLVTVSKTGGSVTLLSDANWNATNQDFKLLSTNTGTFTNSSFSLNTGDIVVQGGTLNGGSGAINADLMKVWAGGTVHLPSAEVILGANFNGAGSYDVLDISGTVTHSGSGQVTLRGTRNANIKASSGNLNLNYLKIDKGASSVYLLNGDLTVQDQIELVDNLSFYAADNAITTHDLTLNGTMYFEDNGSLVQTSGGVLNGTGEIDYQRKGINYQAGFNLWSSPVVQADLFSVFSNSNQCVLYGFDQAQQLWRFDLPAGQALGCPGFPTMNVTWAMGANSGYTVDGKMDIGLGYAATGSTIPNDDIRTFVGRPNNGVITKAVRATNITTTVWDLSDWNLLGNPYPSGLSMSGFWQENAVNNTRIEGGLYFMVDPGPGNPQYHQYNDFAVYNGIGFLPPLNTPGLTHNGFIGAGQGFWVDAVGPAGTVSNVEFNNSMRSGTNDEFYKRGNNLSSPDGKVYLSITHSSFTSNQVLVGTKFDATMGRDGQYDAEQGYEGVMPPVALMTMIGRKGFVIQGIPPIDPDTYREIPLYVHTTYDGLHTFEVNNMEQFSGHTMYIEDRVKGTKTAISPTANHTVRLMQGDYQNRFYLVIENGNSSNTTVKNIADEVFQSGLSVTPIGGGVVTYQQGGKLMIDAVASESEISSVEIFDVVGRRIYIAMGKSDRIVEIEKADFSDGVYVVTVRLIDETQHSVKLPIVR